MEGSSARKHLANLTHPDEAIRHKAKLALGDGERHRDWAPDLVVAVTEGSPDERFWAASPLARAADPGLAVPALIAMLYEPDRPANRQVATFTLVYALDDADQRVQEEAIQSLSLLGERASDALPALRGLASSDGQTAAIRSDASEAVERILGRAPAYRGDEPYRTLEYAVSKGRFSVPGVPDEARTPRAPARRSVGAGACRRLPRRGLDRRWDPSTGWPALPRQIAGPIGTLATASDDERRRRHSGSGSRPGAGGGVLGA